MTQLLLAWCQSKVNEAKDSWASGAYQTEVQNAYAVGNVTAFGEILELDSETLNGVLDKDE